MPKDVRTITAADILPLAEWAHVRVEHRKALSLRKLNRRIAIGPYATIIFENWDTMWYQVQEMLWIEKGGDEQLPDELAAYNPMIPKGNELTATFMIEIPDEAKRRAVLATLGGIEDRISLIIAGEAVPATYENEVERTTADGKTSAVHFLHFALSAEQAAQFKGGAEAMLRIDHPNYGHAAMISEAVRAELAGDL